MPMPGVLSQLQGVLLKADDVVRRGLTAPRFTKFAAPYRHVTQLPVLRLEVLAKTWAEWRQPILITCLKDFSRATIWAAPPRPERTAGSGSSPLLTPVS